MSKQKWKWICLVLTGAVLAVAAFFAAKSLWQAPAAKPNSAQTEETASIGTAATEQIDLPAFEPISLGSGIRIVKLGSYAGLFVEDGSDALVNGIVQATVENIGADDVQYMRFSLTAEDGTSYEFELTTLLAGQTVAVLEKNQAEFRQDVSITAQKVEDYAVYPEAPSLHSDVFEVHCEGNLISVTNISQAPVSAGRVFYKNMVGSIYIGGITYMLSFTDLEPGETLQLSSAHFSEDSSRILFITYAEQ